MRTTTAFDAIPQQPWHRETFISVRNSDKIQVACDCGLGENHPRLANAVRGESGVNAGAPPASGAPQRRGRQAGT